MTIESIKRSLSATELNRMDKEAIRHTNIAAFAIKVFFESGCSIAAVRDALNARKEDRLDQLYFIALRLISTYAPDMDIPDRGIPVYANVMEHTLLNIMKNEAGQNILVLWDFSGEDECKTVLRVIDDELLNNCKQLVTNTTHAYSGDLEHAVCTIRIIDAAKPLQQKLLSPNREEFINFVEKEMVDKYGKFFWTFATEIAAQRKLIDAQRSQMYRNNCIVA